MKKISKLYVRLCSFIVSIFFWLVFKIFWGFKIEGKENLPPQGPYFIVANHQHMFDPTLIAGSNMFKQIFFMAKEELFKYSIGNLFFRSIGAFPVKRGKPDRYAIRTTLQHIKDGYIVCLFPEGTTQGHDVIGEAKDSVAKLLYMANAKVVPAYINLNRWKRPVSIKYGEAFTISFGDERPTKEQLVQKSQEIMDKIKAIRENK